MLIDIRIQYLDQGENHYNVTAGFFDIEGELLNKHTWEGVSLSQAQNLIRARLLTVRRRTELKRGLRRPDDLDAGQLELPFDFDSGGQS